MLLPKEKLQLLSMVDVLEPLSQEQIEELMQRLPDTHFEQGQTTYTPDYPSETLFLLKRGRVRIYRLDPKGEGKLLPVVGDGTLSGRWRSPLSAWRERTRRLWRRRRSASRSVRT